MKAVASGSDSARRIEALLDESERLEDRVRRWQRGRAPSPADTRQASRDYQAWYAAAFREVPEADRARFRDMYEGGAVIKRIRAYLSAPLAVHPLYKKGENNPLVDQWLHPVDKTFGEAISIQREILVAAMHAKGDPAAVLGELTNVMRRLPDYLAVLARAGSSSIPAPQILNEKDLQVVVHAVLRLLYDDVRPEDAVPQHAGGASRVDFLLREAGVIIETKMTRDGLGEKQVQQELLIDWGRYPRHPDCRAILAVVYDPERRIGNISALENDLTNDQGNPVTRAIVVR